MSPYIYPAWYIDPKRYPKFAAGLDEAVHWQEAIHPGVEYEVLVHADDAEGLTGVRTAEQGEVNPALRTVYFKMQREG